MPHRVAIAGAGLGGLRAAEQLRAAGHDGPITVIGAEQHMPYNRPPLSKELLARDLADAETAPGDDADDLTALHQRVAFRRRASVADVTFRLGVPVTAARLNTGLGTAPRAEGELVLADGDVVRFDGLVVATGLRPRRLNVPGPAGPGSGRHVLRTLDDCASLRAALRSALSATAHGASRPHVVVVGAGFVGCEVACTALALGCDVTVVEPAGPPMFRVLGEELAQAVQRAHERAGMTFVLRQAVIAYAGHDHVTGVVVADGTDASSARVSGGPASGGLALTGPALANTVPENTVPENTVRPNTVPANTMPANTVLPADLVVEAIGSLPNTEWLAGNGLDLTDGVLCDNSLSAVSGAPATRASITPASMTGAPVTVVGDVARFPNPLFDDVPRRVEHWSMPTDTSRRAATTLQAKMAGDPIDPASFRPLPYFWSDQGDLRMQSFGSPGLADEVVIAEGDLDELDKGVLVTYHRGGRLVGSVAFNLPPVRYRQLREALLA
jgi:3-phenylpropionate/trans-cinnamate dioxygenase ferredoxin reductase component